MSTSFICPPFQYSQQIRLSKDTVEKLNDDLKTLRQSQRSVPDAVTTRLAALLDMRERGCSRLGTASFIIVLETLLQAGYSRQKERGIYLLAVEVLSFK